MRRRERERERERERARESRRERVRGMYEEEEDTCMRRRIHARESSRECRMEERKHSKRIYIHAYQTGKKDNGTWNHWSSSPVKRDLISVKRVLIRQWDMGAWFCFGLELRA